MINVSRKKGFTLIEIMMTMVIVAILVGLALPSARETLRKSRRSDAMEVLSRIHLAQERYRINHATYGTLTQLGAATDPLISPDGHYSLAIDSTSATAYRLVATALGDQASDFCGTFTLTFNAGVITKTTSSGDAAVCWRK